MNNPLEITRRKFVQVCGLAAGGLTVRPVARSLAATPRNQPPLAIFSKVYQELKLDYKTSAQLTAEAGLEGVDCTVRPGGEVAPEKVAEQLLQYHKALKTRGLKILAIATAITSVSSPNARAVLETARRLGVRHYRVGFWRVKPGEDARALISQAKSELRNLAALNKELGICGLIENHSHRFGDAAYLGGNLEEMRELVADFDPKQVGVAFDLGHAMITAPENWKSSFEKLRSHVRLVYLKDVNTQGQFVPFGTGRFAQSGFFEMLRQAKYSDPISLHIEYNWAQGKPKTEELLKATLRQCRSATRKWLEAF